jgi:hypothetical protein
MPDLNEQLWNVIGSLGFDDGSPLHAGAVARLERMGLVGTVDGAPRLTARGEEAYVALESGDDFPGLE